MKTTTAISHQLFKWFDCVSFVWHWFFFFVCVCALTLGRIVQVTIHRGLEDLPPRFFIIFFFLHPQKILMAFYRFFVIVWRSTCCCFLWWSSNDVMFLFALAVNFIGCLVRSAIGWSQSGSTLIVPELLDVAGRCSASLGYAGVVIYTLRLMARDQPIGIRISFSIPVGKGAVINISVADAFRSSEQEEGEQKDLCRF